MPVKIVKIPSFRISSPEGVTYVCYEEDPLYRLRASMESYAEEERLLPLELLVNPSVVLKPHVTERRALVERIQRYGAKLDMEAVIELVAKLRRLVLADWFMSKLYANVTYTDEGTTGASSGAGANNQPVLEDEVGGHSPEPGGDDDSNPRSDSSLKAPKKRRRKGAIC